MQEERRNEEHEMKNTATPEEGVQPGQTEESVPVTDNPEAKKEAQPVQNQPQAAPEVVAEETVSEEDKAAPDSTDDASEKEEDFGAMLEQQEARNTSYEIGDEVTGKIINISESYIFISLGDKIDGVAEISDYYNENGELPYEEGDELQGYVVRITDTEIIVSKSLTRATASRSLLQDAFEKKIPVNGKVESIIKGGFAVEVLGERAFCPISQIHIRPVADNTEFLGKNFDFEIIDLSENGRNIVISRRKLLERERQRQKEETLENIEVGSEVQGRVTRLTNFGAFIDIGGIEGLLHISEMAWHRVDSPSEILNIGDEITVKVIKLKNEKISLSLKAMQPNPLVRAMEELEAGQIVSCRVVKNESFGSFVEIRPGVQGLIPISEMARGRRVNTPSEVVHEGDLVEAKIMRVNTETRKISLSLKALEPDPWDNIDEILHVDEMVEGHIDGVTEYGTFIKIHDGLTGLLPRSKMRIAKISYTEENLGDAVQVRVADLDREKRRISLEPINMPSVPQEPEYEDRAPRRGRGRREREDWTRYAKQKWDSPDDNPFQDL